MEFLIRPGKQEDIEQLVELFYESERYHTQNAPHFFRHPSRDWVRQSLKHLFEDPHVIFLVACKGDAIAGFCRSIFKQQPDIELLKQGQIAQIEDLVVAPQFRRRGVAGQLLSEIEK